jgi:probable phosphoglycerate mutase
MMPSARAKPFAVPWRGAILGSRVAVQQLLLIRHAANDWLGQRLAGHTPGVHLNEAGRAQARRVAERLGAYRLAAVYSSPLERAVETAQIIAAPHNLSVDIVDGLAEANFGRWSGKPLKELEAQDTWHAVQVYPSGTRFPDGETMGEVQARAVQAVEHLRSVNPGGGTLLAVSHADVVKAVVAYYVGLHLDLFQRLVVMPASITVLGLTTLGPRLLTFNDTGDLPALLNAAPVPDGHSRNDVD